MQGNSQHRSRQSGFTLLELTIALVLIGLLAAVVTSRYVDLRREALISTMQGLRHALQSAATLVHAKAAVAGVADRASATIDIDGVTIDLVYGYPAGSATGIVQLLDPPASGWNDRQSSYPGAWVYWHGEIEQDAWPARCFIRYRQPVDAASRPVIDWEDSGC